MEGGVDQLNLQYCQKRKHNTFVIFRFSAEILGGISSCETVTFPYTSG